MAFPNSLEEVLDEAAKLIGSGSRSREFLMKQREQIAALKEQFPSMADAIDRALAGVDAQIAKLDLAATPENIALLPVTLVAELARFKSEGFDRGRHPGSVTGG